MRCLKTGNRPQSQTSENSTLTCWSRTDSNPGKYSRRPNSKSLPDPFVPMDLFSLSWCDVLENAIRSSLANDDGELPSSSA